MSLRRWIPAHALVKIEHQRMETVLLSWPGGRLGGAGYNTGMLSRRTFLLCSTAVTAVGQNIVNTKLRGAPFLQHLAIFDRGGKLLRILGEAGYYAEPDFSPDASKVAVTSPAQQISIFDLVSGARKFGPVSASQPIWSPDGRQIAYVSFRDGYGRLHRTIPSIGNAEELLFQSPQAARLNLADWSTDGRFITFFSGSCVYVLPLKDRTSLEFVREPYNAEGGSISPDGTFVAYRSNESGRYEIYVKTLDLTASRPSAGQKWRVSEDGGVGLIHWRRDGEELYYLSPNGGLMAAVVTKRPAFRVLKTTALFQVPETIPTDEKQFPRSLGTFSRDGQRIALAVPIAPERKEVAVAPSILAKYAGTYYLPDFNVDAVVSVEGEQLMIEYTGAKKLRLFAESETSFFLKVFPGDFDFSEDDNGRITHFVQYFGDYVNTARRK